MSLKTSNSVFGNLRAEPQQFGRMITHLTDVRSSAGAVIRAVDSLGKSTLLIPVSINESLLEEWDIPAISIEYKDVSLKSGYHRFLVLQCLQEALDSQFGYLIDDVLEAIKLAPEKAVLSTFRTISRWKALLREKQNSYLTQEQLIGVLGELLFLEEVSDVLGSSNVLQYWQGPSGARHDFEFHNSSFEVKATQAREQFVVGIHGAKQLELTDGLPLYLVGFQFEKSIDGITLPGLVDNLISAGFNRFELLNKLSEVGYDEYQSSYYRTLGYCVVAKRMCIVDDNFPKITSETMNVNILNRITKVNYSVDINGCSESLPLADILSEVS